MPGKPSQGRPYCRGEKTNGDPCRNRAAAGSAYCASHGGGKRKPGRKTKLTNDVVATIVQALERGVTYEVAALAAGIDKSTLHDWRRKGAADLEAGKATPFAHLVDELTRATAEAEVGLVRVIRSHAMMDWKAAAWLLERRAPERWARPDSKADSEVDDRAKPREVAPVDKTRAQIVTILAAATKAPATSD